MADESELQEKFPDIEAINRFLGREELHLMDLNHRVYKNIIKEIDWIEQQRAEANDIFDQVLEALAIGAWLTSDAVANRIKDKYSIFTSADAEAEAELEDPDPDEEEGEESE